MAAKPGCDWLLANLPKREASRKAEAKSLTAAMQLIKVGCCFEACKMLAKCQGVPA